MSSDDLASGELLARLRPTPKRSLGKLLLKKNKYFFKYHSRTSLERSYQIWTMCDRDVKWLITIHDKLDQQIEPRMVRSYTI